MKKTNQITTINTTDTTNTTNTNNTKGEITMKNTRTKKHSFKTRLIATALSAITILSVMMLLLWDMRDDFMAKQSAESVMRKTIPQSEEFERYWNGVHKNSICLKKYLPETMESYKDVIDGIADFYSAYPTAPIYKEKVIRPFLDNMK